MENAARHIAIYARKSTESEDRQILSIDSQVRELQEFARREGLRVDRVLTESRSARSPGRTVFNHLFSLVQKGKVDGILCWKLDRLARNPVDGGAVIWAMEEQQLHALYTPLRMFANSGNDKFWMQLEFGMAKKYVDDLSDNVKRGIRAKIELGWQSGLPPLGYLNDRLAKTIVKDPERFLLVRRMWDLMLTGQHTPQQVLKIATNQWGLRTRTFKRSGGKPLARSHMYKLFANPFYYGAIVHRGEYFQGKQPPMISKSEYDRVQRFLGNASSPRGQEQSFAFRGLIKCGECGASVTAEHKVNRQGHKYTYYHCTKRKTGVTCGQRVIEAAELERQVIAFLERITISHAARDWAVQRATELNAEESAKDRSGIESLRRRDDACKRELTELVNVRLRGLLTDEEYLAKKRELQEERARIHELLDDTDGRFTHALDQSIAIFDYAKRAKELFENGSQEEKRAVLAFTGSNLKLRDKVLSIEAQKPLLLVQRVLQSHSARTHAFEPVDSPSTQQKKGRAVRGLSSWCTLVDDVRTYCLSHPQAVPAVQLTLPARQALPSARER